MEKTSNSFSAQFFDCDQTYGTYIHPSSIVEKSVVLGENVKIGPSCTIVGNTYIGSGTRLYGFVSIGMPAHDVNTKNILGSVEIGKNCEIKEFVTISSPKIADSKTIIKDNCYIMNFCHVAHDVVLEENVVLINNVNLGGHVHIGRNAMLMANTALHQFCKVGAYSALAPFSGMRQDIPPFCIFNGRPGRFSGLNVVALKRAGFSSDDIGCVKTITKLFFQDKLPFEEIEKHMLSDAVLRENKHVQEIVHFIKHSSRGITRRTISDT